MPYIPQEDRSEILEVEKNEDGSLVLFLEEAVGPGELNFQITKLLLAYMANTGKMPNYAMYNEIIGVLESVKLEFYRRMVAPYEDRKERENGDVYVVTQ